MSDATSFVEECLLETDGMTQREKTAYMKRKVQGTIKSFSQTTRYADHEWLVGEIPGTVIRDVCR